MCYACQNPFTASTDEKSVWIQEYGNWAQCDEAESQSIYDNIVENADDLMETLYCECGESDEEECDPEAESDEEEFCVKTKLAEYRERIKKVLDTFEIIKADDPANEYDFDLYLDIETGRVFDLEVNEYFL